MPTLGLADWRPGQKSLALINQVQGILDQYEAELPLTGRQIFYRLVAEYQYDKTEQAYKRLLDKINRARRSGLISWKAIRDDGVTNYLDTGDESLHDQLDLMTNYRIDPRRGQGVQVELWVEANGMTRQAWRAVGHYGCAVRSSGGFNSSTMKHQSAVRMLNNALNGTQTVLLHCGDHDPSGVSIFENIEQDLTQFILDLIRQRPALIETLSDHAQAAGMSSSTHDALTWTLPIFERIAITEEQAIAGNYPSAPPKRTDSRTANWEGETWQAEAIPPNELSDIFRDSVQEHIDMDLYRANREAQQLISARFEEWLEDVEMPDISDIDVPGGHSGIVT